VAILNTLFSVFLLTAPAQEPRTSVRDVVALTGRVELIDKFTRSLTLRTAEGSLHTIGVGLELELFDGLKSGDKVTVRVVESVIVELHPNAKPGVVTDTTAAVKKERSGVVQQLKAVVTIESVDISTGVVVYKTGDNRRVMRAVADANLLTGLNPGAVVEVTYTRERAVDLQRQR